MRTYNITIDDSDQGKLFEEFDRPPVCRFATTWLLRDLGLFRVNVSIVGPESEQSKGYFPLSDGQAYHILETVADIIKTLEKQAR